MKASMAESCWLPLKRRLVMRALLLGLTGSQIGFGCECAGVISLATRVILLGRELQEAKKMDLEIERLKQDRQPTVDSR